MRTLSIRVRPLFCAAALALSGSQAGCHFYDQGRDNLAKSAQKDFQDANWVTVERRRITLADRPALEARAQAKL